MYNTGTAGPTPGTGRSRYVRQQIQHLGKVGQGMYNTGTAGPTPGTGRSRFV